ncbi:glycosyltransferase family 2 protein [uncultured Flavobacterium sp.]|uniref:glycosyltransferase family 2 protein n=1 Tax=uncultured Flavobacterium sp. TaxID=165435 RepID=UPI0030816D5E
MNKGFVIIVTYNGMKWIEECLKSVLNSSVSTSIIVIDNNSSDDTVLFIKEKFSDVILLEQKHNLGFGKANNLGMNYALKQNADFVFLLNQDAFLEQNTIENLINSAQINPDFGILSPIQLEYSGKFLEYYFYKFMTEDNSRAFFSDFVLKQDMKSIYDIDFIQAAAWFLPIDTVKKIGGFDPIFYHYGEDNNYCQRVKFHQLNIGVVPNSFIRHDSHKPKKADHKLFSEKYFDNYLRGVYFTYANINNAFGQKEINKELKKSKKLLVRSFVRLNFTKVFGYVKQIRLFKNKIECINNSRATNKKIHINHL